MPALKVKMNCPVPSKLPPLTQGVIPTKLMLGGDALRGGNQFLPGGNGVCDPPDPISNSEVKPYSADDSVRFLM